MDEVEKSGSNDEDPARHAVPTPPKSAHTQNRCYLRIVRGLNCSENARAEVRLARCIGNLRISASQASHFSSVFAILTCQLVLPSLKVIAHGLSKILQTSLGISLWTASQFRKFRHKNELITSLIMNSMNSRMSSALHAIGTSRIATILYMGACVGTGLLRQLRVVLLHVYGTLRSP